MKLGKLAARYDPRTLHLSKYLSAGAPTPPASSDWSRLIDKWPMMANDRLGDCTCAAAGHMIQQWSLLANNPSIPTDADIVKAYTAVSGYDPRTGANDNGAVELDVLNYWTKTGIAGHQISGYLSIEPGNKTLIQDAIYLFGAAYLGISLPASAQDQLDQKAPWTVPAGGLSGRGAPGSWGGHAVPAVAYDARFVTCVTWGALQRMTWEFFAAYCEEAYAVLSPDWIDQSSNLSPGSLDLQTLQQDLQAL